MGFPQDDLEPLIHWIAERIRVRMSICILANSWFDCITIRNRGVAVKVLILVFCNLRSENISLRKVVLRC